MRSCSEWTQSDGQDLSDKKDHSTVQMHMMHMAYGYYLMLAGFNANDPKHKTIQDWIGKIGIKSIDGCYYNVMGLPLQTLYSYLSNL